MLGELGLEVDANKARGIEEGEGSSSTVSKGNNKDDDIDDENKVKDASVEHPN